jgi:hypothetical protein
VTHDKPLAVHFFLNGQAVLASGPLTPPEILAALQIPFCSDYGSRDPMHGHAASLVGVQHPSRVGQLSELYGPGSEKYPLEVCGREFIAVAHGDRRVKWFNVDGTWLASCYTSIAPAHILAIAGKVTGYELLCADRDEPVALCSKLPIMVEGKRFRTRQAAVFIR